jgi:uncharacterized protein YdhG (YjbR/CyaY superfamily)
MVVPVSVEAYLAALPADKRAALEKIRKVIGAAVPKAEEGISYGIPTFKLYGRMLGSYGAAAKHCALYGFVGANKELVKGYDTSPGTIRFPVDKPLPAALVKALVKEQVARVEAAVAAMASVVGAGKKPAKSAVKKSATKQVANKDAKKVSRKDAAKVAKTRLKK